MCLYFVYYYQCILHWTSSASCMYDTLCTLLGHPKVVALKSLYLLIISQDCLLGTFIAYLAIPQLKLLPLNYFLANLN